VPRQLELQLISANELSMYLDQLEASTSSMKPMFLSIGLSSLITLALAWIASPPTGWAVAGFTGAAVSLVILSAYFGLETWREHRATRRKRARLAQRLGVATPVD
jgi:hypothetical protein